MWKALDKAAGVLVDAMVVKKCHRASVSSTRVPLTWDLPSLKIGTLELSTGFKVDVQPIVLMNQEEPLSQGRAAFEEKAEQRVYLRQYYMAR